MPTIHFIREDKRVEVPEGTNLRAYCKGAGVQIYPWHARIGNCLGNGLCGTCLVRVDDAEGLSARTLAEERYQPPIQVDLTPSGILLKAEL